MRQQLADRSGPSDTESDAGCAEELSEVYLRYGALVRRTLKARISDDHVVEDLAAQTWECAMQLACQGRVGELRAGWFVVVANRRAVDYWRRLESDRRRRAVLRNEAIVAQRQEIALADLEGNNVGMSPLLTGIGERQRRALVLRYLDSGSVSEVATAMGLSYAATESLLARARRSARRRVAKMPELNVV